MSDCLRIGLTPQIPELVLVVGALLIVLIGRRAAWKLIRWSGGLALTASLIAFAVAVPQAWPVLSAEEPSTLFHGLVISDGLAVFGKTLVLFSLILGILPGYRGALSRTDAARFHALVLLSAFGAIVVAGAAHLATLLLGLEILSLPLYTLAAFEPDRRGSREAGIKFFLLGILVTGFFVLGCAFYYIGAGTLAIADVTVPEEGRVLYSIGSALILAALLFKGGLLPFLAWVPDIAEGAPGHAVGLMAALAMVASFAALTRAIPEMLLGNASTALQPGLMLIAIATIVAGNFLALVQTRLRRMLAYLAVALAGCMLLGLLVLREDASRGALFCLATLSPVLIGCFHLLAYHPDKPGGPKVDDLAGLGRASPFHALAFALLMASMAGIPPMAGFMARAMTFLGVAGAGLTWAVTIGMVASLPGVYCAMRVVAVMYAKDPTRATKEIEDAKDVSVPLGEVGLWIAVAVVVIFGIAPAPLLYFADLAVHQLGRLTSVAG